MASNKPFGGYSKTEAQQIAVSAIFANIKTSDWRTVGINQIHEAISEMIACGDESTVAVMFLKASAGDYKAERKVMSAIKNELRERQETARYLTANRS